MTWGIAASVIERFTGAGVPKENLSFARESFTFNSPAPTRALVASSRDYDPPRWER
jgi:hypothetical protein